MSSKAVCCYCDNCCHRAPPDEERAERLSQAHGRISQRSLSLTIIARLA
ncbi:MAG TPA: hypothetical protein VGC64_02545 [Pyrinomonadaceae bacterium]